VNPAYLPAIGQSLRKLGEYATWREVNDETLAEVAAELDRARAAVAGARGNPRANSCTRHPGGPVDPTVPNGCLLCGPGKRQPAAPPPQGVTPGEVLRFAEVHGHGAAAERYGGRALARAVAIGERHPSNPRRQPAAGSRPDNEGDMS
jgi:hypothetical protein